MAPPKRKTTGRVTPKGTKPGQLPTAPAQHLGKSGGSASGGKAESSIGASSRYTPPTPKSHYESPRWVPILMFTLLALGGITIMLRYIVWENTNTPVLVGLGFLLAGLGVATKWK